MTQRPDSPGDEHDSEGGATDQGAAARAADDEAAGASGRAPMSEDTAVSESEDSVEPDTDAVVESTRRERDEYLDMLRRVQADFENYKKRMIRQQTELLERAAQGLVEKLLPSLDALDLARSHLSESEGLSEEGKALLQASALIFDTLAKEGLEREDATGGAFDPTSQEAVEHEAPPSEEAAAEARSGSEGADAESGSQGDGAPDGPVVVAVLRPGYRWKGRVVRPAMVRVRG
jgi:molecular chaperone GrpE